MELDGALWVIVNTFCGITVWTIHSLNQFGKWIFFGWKLDTVASHLKGISHLHHLIPWLLSMILLVHLDEYWERCTMTVQPNVLLPMLIDLKILSTVSYFALLYKGVWLQTESHPTASRSSRAEHSLVGKMFKTAIMTSWNIAA